MSHGRPHATLEPLAAVRALEGALSKLVAAGDLSEDLATLDGIKAAKRELRTTITRARAVLAHVELCEAEQTPLFPS